MGNRESILFVSDGSPLTACGDDGLGALVFILPLIPDGVTRDPLWVIPDILNRESISLVSD